MTTAVSNAKALVEAVGEPVILVHHSGKDLGRGLRGHTSLLGAVDASIEVVNHGGARTFTVKKNKDGADGGVGHFELVSHFVGRDQWGGELQSCAVKQSLTPAVSSPPPPTGKHQKAIMAALADRLATAPDGVPLETALSSPRLHSMCQQVVA